jgi:hypothetical protein
VDGGEQEQKQEEESRHRESQRVVVIRHAGVRVAVVVG